MTVIRLDARTLAKVQAASDALYLADETGMPLLRCAVRPVIDHEPDLSDEEWREMERDAIESSLEDVWSKIRYGEECLSGRRQFFPPSVNWT